MQGDTLASLLASVRQVEGLLKKGASTDELADRVVDVCEQLEAMLARY